MNRDFRDLLSEFNAHRVEYLIVGAFAMAAYGRVRATGDLDVWVRPEPDNARRVLSALRAFGAPLQDLTESDLSQPGVVFQIGLAPVRIDVLTGIDGVSFEQAWSERFTTRYADQAVQVLSARHMIANKRAVGRYQDLADAQWLESHVKK